LRALSLFSGCGGLDLGARQAGIETVLAIDHDATAIDTYKRNISSDAIVADLTNSSSIALPNNIDLLIGGPPCQGFSSAGPKRSDDPRNKLWGAYLEVLKKSNAKSFLLENVPGFESELSNFLEEIEKTFPGKFRIEHKKLISQYYGVPQFRHRLFVIGVLKKFADLSLWPTPTDIEVFNYTKKFPSMITIKEAIEDLGPPNVAEDKYGPGGLDHAYVKLSSSDEFIAAHIPNGGSLKDIPDSQLPKPYAGRVRGPKGWTWYFRKPRIDLPARSVLASIRPNFSTILAPDVIYGNNSGTWKFENVERDSFTDSSGFYTSPIAPRRLTVREYARIQTFPDDFEFSGTMLEKYRMIGNAVPCSLGQQLCESIKRAIES
jgi:DNA (cytosine-5)-methyltransferase 1